MSFTHKIVGKILGDKKSKNAICPKCGEDFDDKRPAISRRDNKTKICSDCGVTEAMEDWARHSKK
jgi:predicted RNA-binding Zn-ribbon protein involved in translation (DUF1610 family)